MVSSKSVPVMVPPFGPPVIGPLLFKMVTFPELMNWSPTMLPSRGSQIDAKILSVAASSHAMRMRPSAVALRLGVVPLTLSMTKVDPSVVPLALNWRANSWSVVSSSHTTTKSPSGKPITSGSFWELAPLAIANGPFTLVPVGVSTQARISPPPVLKSSHTTTKLPFDRAAT